MAEAIHELGEEQQLACNILEYTRNNVFVTGKAGTGKSYLLKYFVRNTAKKVVVLAPTGVAAINAGGQTIHSFFAFDHTILDPAEVRINRKTAEILQEIDAFIIDEVSMVRSDLMECVNRKFQIALNNDLPFGGKQMIAFGDLYQLDPIVGDRQAETYLNEVYGGKHFFNAPVIRECNLTSFELSHIYRQKDIHFQELLNEIRDGTAGRGTIREFNHRYDRFPETDEILTIATTNHTVNAINSERLAALPGEVCSYQAEIRGDPRDCIKYTDEKLHLKMGAQVMLLRNKWEKGRLIWANGTIGRVVGLYDDRIRVAVEDRVFNIEKVTWDTKKYKYDEVTGQLITETVAQFTQFPVCLAWAMTIHKAQGKTFRRVNVDFGRGAFAHGQAYVALSRSESMEGLYLSTPLKGKDIIIHSDVARFMTSAAMELEGQTDDVADDFDGSLSHEVEMFLNELDHERDERGQESRPVQGRDSFDNAAWDPGQHQ